MQFNAISVHEKQKLSLKTDDIFLRELFRLFEKDRTKYQLDLHVI